MNVRRGNDLDRGFLSTDVVQARATWQKEEELLLFCFQDQSSSNVQSINYCLKENNCTVQYSTALQRYVSFPVYNIGCYCFKNRLRPLTNKQKAAYAPSVPPSQLYIAQRAQSESGRRCHPTVTQSHSWATTTTSFFLSKTPMTLALASADSSLR